MGRLEDYRVAELLRGNDSFGGVRQSLLSPAEDGSLGQERDLASGCLIAEGFEVLDLGPHKDDPCIGTRLGERGLLGQEPVPRMDRIGPGLLGSCDDRVDIQVRLDRLAGDADLVRLIRLEAVQCVPVLIGVDRDRPNPQLVRRAEHADRNFGPVGNEQLGDGGYVGVSDGSQHGGVLTNIEESSIVRPDALGWQASGCFASKLQNWGALLKSRKRQSFFLRKAPGMTCEPENVSRRGAEIAESGQKSLRGLCASA